MERLPLKKGRQPRTEQSVARLRILLCCLILNLLSIGAGQAQILYGVLLDGTVVKINAATCEICATRVLLGASQGINDIVMLPNGNILAQSGGGGGGLYLYEPGNPNPIWSSGDRTLGSILAPNGLVYISTLDPNIGLSVFDPATNTLTFIGPWPPNGIGVEFFYENGILYAVGHTAGPPATSHIMQVNTTDPSLSIILLNNAPTTQNGGGMTNGAYTTMITNTKMLHRYDVSTNTFEFICNFMDIAQYPMLTSGIRGLSDHPLGAQEPPCECEKFAGTVVPDLINLCVPEPATVPHNNDEVLGPNNLLQYILFSDINDTLGSLLIVSNTPTFPYDPAIMQPGVTYYMAAIAGLALNGNVDLNDPCIDISNAAEVVWHTPPDVSFTVPNPDLCTGDCLTLDVLLNGTPPFSLAGDMFSGGNTVGTFAQNYSANTGTLVICAPPGISPGNLLVQATLLSDAYCTCP